MRGVTASMRGVVVFDIALLSFKESDVARNLALPSIRSGVSFIDFVSFFIGKYVRATAFWYVVTDSIRY